MKRTELARPAERSTPRAVTWEELTKRLARHIAKLNRAAFDDRFCRAEMRRWARELDAMGGTPASHKQNKEVNRDR